MSERDASIISEAEVFELAIETINGAIPEEDHFTESQIEAFRGLVFGCLSAVSNPADIVALKGGACAKITKELVRMKNPKLCALRSLEAAGGSRDEAGILYVKGLHEKVVREAVRLKLFLHLENRTLDLDAIIRSSQRLLHGRGGRTFFNAFLMAVLGELRSPEVAFSPEFARLRNSLNEMERTQRKLFVRTLFPEISDEDLKKICG